MRWYHCQWEMDPPFTPVACQSIRYFVWTKISFRSVDCVFDGVLAMVVLLRLVSVLVGHANCTASRNY
jgi:hypothetical protein